MNIAEILHNQVEKYPDTPAIIDTHRGRSRITTFAELELAASRASTMLRQKGLKSGEAVLVFQPMSAELYIALLAIFRIGAIASFLDPSVGLDHISRCCHLNPPKALIASSKAHLLRLVSPGLRQIPLKFAIGLPVPGAIAWNISQTYPPDPQIYPTSNEDPALLTFTSGSTGQPKAAERSHGFLLAQHRALENSLKLTPGEIDLTTLPIFGLANLASGVTSLIPDADLRKPGAIDSKRAIAQIQTYHPTSTAASPALLQRLTEYCTTKGMTLPSFKKIFSGGAPVFPRLLDELQQIAPQSEIIAVYGSTEAEPIAKISQKDLTSADYCGMIEGGGLLVGHKIPEIQLKILRDRWGTPLGSMSRDEFESGSVKEGEVGEIVVSGEHVLSGYLHGMGDEETKFRVEGEKWHRTGDAGYLDKQGRLWLLGRCKACIRDAKGTLYPFAVECAADYHPGVKRSAVVSHKGKRILVVECRDRVGNLESLKEKLRWAEIEEIKVSKKIPVDKRHNAKIDYPALEKMLERN